MPIEINLAKLSPTMESGQLVKWLVKVGDKVREGDTLAKISEEMYGSAGKADTIFEANRSQFRTRNARPTPGQMLKIPPV